MKLDENGRKRLDAMKKALAAGLPLAGLLAATAAFAADPPESPTAGSIPPPPPDVWRTAGEPAPPPTAPDENAVPALPPDDDSWGDAMDGFISLAPPPEDGPVPSVTPPPRGENP